MSEDRGITRLSIGFNKTAAVIKVAPLYGMGKLRKFIPRKLAIKKGIKNNNLPVIIFPS